MNNNCFILCDAAPAAAPDAAPAAAPQSGGMGMMVPMLLILAIFYFMMIRPQQRKEKERQKMIEELRAGAKIIFAGGLMGVIQEATEKTFKVEIAPGVAVEVARASVTAVVPPETPAAK
ncbi:MAG: preprotein translocase subunit YajC [Kiritimatiellae bacterium]|nr:preprotein translocase subunit YajC [Kiritimatiellia bacterium]MBR2355521.1 preprotein translocase subunit YajC [Kiritimatiellia bacterium]